MSDKKTHEVSKYKTSRGVPWSEVLVGELPGMVEDGIEAAALLKAMEARHAGEDRS
jgi:hypothetical protein